MDKQIRRLAMVIVALFVLLIAQVNYIQVFAANSLINNPADATRSMQPGGPARSDHPGRGVPGRQVWIA